MQLLGLLIVINNLFYSSLGGKRLGKAVSQDLEQEAHQDGSDVAANAPEMRKIHLSQGLLPEEPPAFPIAL